MHNRSEDISPSLSSQFSTCLKWKYQLRELYTISENKSFYHWPSNQMFNPGNYRLKNNSLYACIPSNVIPPAFDLDIFFLALWALSLICLLMSFITNIGRSTKTHDYRPMQCYILSLFTTYTMMVIRQTLPTSFINPKWVFVACIFGEFTFFSIYSWQNVMSFDIWRKFRSRQSLMTTDRTTNRFLSKCLYAYGIPLLVIAMGSAKFGLRNYCRTKLFIGRKAIGFFVVVFVNVVLFLLICINLRKLATDVCDVNQRASKKLKYVYSKLLLLTFISGGSVSVAFFLKPMIELYWIFPMVIISLHGVCVFLLFNLPYMKDIQRKNKNLPVKQPGTSSIVAGTKFKESTQL